MESMHRISSSKYTLLYWFKVLGMGKMHMLGFKVKLARLNTITGQKN